MGPRVSKSPMQYLEKKLLPSVRIFVDNDALAFFDINNNCNGDPTYVSKLTDTPMKTLYDQAYNFLVDAQSISYFRTDGYKGRLRTISVTSICIVFCAYVTDENGRVKRSGVYHAESMPVRLPFQDGFPKRAHTFREGLCKLIDTVRSEPYEPIKVKAIGSDEGVESLKLLKNSIIQHLTEKNVEIEPEHLLLGGEGWRNTEFDPQTGRLITYFSEDKENTGHTGRHHHTLCHCHGLS